MKGWILGAALLCIATGANGADWIKVASSRNGTMTSWAMPAQAAGEIWEKLVFGSPQDDDGVLYNKQISLNEINCSQDSDLTIQLTSYLDGNVVSTFSGGFKPIYGAPGSVEAAVIEAYCGTK